MWHWERSVFVDCLSLHIPNRTFRLRRRIPLSFVKRAAEFRDKLALYNATAILTGGSLLGKLTHTKTAAAFFVQCDGT